MLADVDIRNPRTARPITVEVELWYAHLIIVEVTGAGISRRRVNPCSQILRRLPGEVVVRLFAAGDPDVEGAETAGAIRSKVKTETSL